jgi:hypothetical protein
MTDILKNLFRAAESPETVYWECMEIIYKALRLTGCFPYSYDNVSGQMSFSLLSVMYGVVLYVIQFIVVSRTNLILIESDNSWVSFIVGLKTIAKALSMTPLILYLSSWLELRNLIKFVNCFQVFLKENFDVTDISHQNFKPWKLKFTIFIYFTFDFIMCTIDFSYYSDIVHLLSYVSTFLLLFLIPIFWVVNCNFISKICRCTVTNFSNELSNSIGPEEVLKYRVIWMELQHKAQEFINAVGLTILIYSISMFIVLVLNSYAAMCALIYERNIIDAIGPAVFFAMNFIHVIILCETTYQMSQEITLAFNYQVLSLSFNGQKIETLNETILFLDMIEVSFKDFEVCNFFKIDRSLMISIISTIISYNVVLLQLDLSV